MPASYPGTVDTDAAVGGPEIDPDNPAHVTVVTMRSGQRATGRDRAVLGRRENGRLESSSVGRGKGASWFGGRWWRTRTLPPSSVLVHCLWEQGRIAPPPTAPVHTNASPNAVSAPVIIFWDVCVTLTVPGCTSCSWWRATPLTPELPLNPPSSTRT